MQTSFAAPILSQYLKPTEEVNTDFEAHLFGPQPTYERNVAYDVKDLVKLKDFLDTLYASKVRFLIAFPYVLKDAKTWQDVIEACNSEGNLEEVAKMYPLLLHRTLEIAPEVALPIIKAGMIDSQRTNSLNLQAPI